LAKRKRQHDMEEKLIGNADEIAELYPKLTGDFKLMQSFWSSPEAFAANVEKAGQNNSWNDSGWGYDSGEDWYGTKSMQDALKLIREGWKEGAEKASRLQGKILSQHPLQRKQISYDIVGAYPNVPRAVAGNPLNMRVPDLTKASRRPVVTLMSNMGASCGHSSDELVNRAAVVAALVDQIEAAGYACEVIGMAWGANNNHGIKVRTNVILKNSSQPVDITRLAFGLGHASMFRRLVFAEWCQDPFTKDLGSHLGYPDALKPSKELAENNVYVIPSVQGHGKLFKTEEAAETEGLKFILRSMRDQGFPMFKKLKWDDDPKEGDEKPILYVEAPPDFDDEDEDDDN
jgi:hypothetical protein